MRVLAVDFGTSNTVAALGVDGGAPRLVTIDGSPLVPSSVFLTDDGTLAVGRDADRQARMDPSRYEPNPKRRIDDGFILLGTSALPVTTVIAEVLKRVAGEVRRQLGGAEPDQLRLTHPARWGQRRKDTLIAAAREAGLGSDPILIPEPVAAATHFATLSSGGLAEGQALAVYDLGGGTFDIAVVKRQGANYEVAAEAGLPDLGGLDFDHAILTHVGSSHAAEIDAEAWQKLLHPTDAASRRQARVLAADIKDGKEALSRYPHVDIALPAPFTDVHLTRVEFEDLIRPNLSRSVELMSGTISDAGFQANQLAGVYLVGGSSRIPLVARLIQQGLGITPTTLDQPETSVVTGALYLPLGNAPAAAPAPAAPVTPNWAQGQSGYTAMPPYRPGPPSGQQQAVRPDQTLRPAVPAAYQGPPSMPRPAVPGPQTAGHPSGGQRAVGHQTGPGLPQIHVRQAVPQTRVRQLAQNPPPAPPRQPTQAPSPSDPSGGRGKLIGIITGAVVLVLAVVLVIVFVTKGGNNNAGGTTGGTTTGPTPSPTSTLEQFFDDDAVKEYVKPTFPEITSCKRGFGTGTSATQVPSSATCTYANGISASFAKATSNSTLDLYQQTFASALPSVFGTQPTEGTWTNGHKDLYDGTSVVGLYWDDKTNGIFGFALIDKNKMKITDLETWWANRFG